MSRHQRFGRLATILAGIALTAGCGGGAPSPSVAPARSVASVEPSPSASASASPTAEPTPSATAVTTVTLDAPESVVAGAPFQVAWAGPTGQGDYITMVVMGVTQRTNEQTITTSTPSPGTLIAPTKPGEYELWYVRGASDLAIARRPITVTKG